MMLIFAFCYQDDPPPPEDDENKEKRTDDISTWDADFLKVSEGLLKTWSSIEWKGRLFLNIMELFRWTRGLSSNSSWPPITLISR